MKKCNLVILDTAQYDLEEIAIVRLNMMDEKSAKSLVDKILSRLERLEIYPLSCPLINDTYLARMGYRILVCVKYLCIYRVIDNNVYVYHIVSGAENYPALLKNIE